MICFFNPFLKGMFEMGANCDCGAKISAKSVSKNKCEATIALANHLVYPTYCILDRVEEDASVKHWALVLDICKIATNETMHYFFQGFTHQNEVILFAAFTTYFIFHIPMAFTLRK